MGMTACRGTGSPVPRSMLDLRAAAGPSARRTRVPSSRPGNTNTERLTSSSRLALAAQAPCARPLLILGRAPSPQKGTRGPRRSQGWTLGVHWGRFGPQGMRQTAPVETLRCTIGDVEEAKPEVLDSAHNTYIRERIWTRYTICLTQ
jgi:hypothetical protein